MDSGQQTSPGGAIDALLPVEIARKAEHIGAQKVRVDPVKLLALAVLAGAFIGLGAMFATTVMTGASGVVPFGMLKLVAGIVFSLGLILVVLGGAELFTGNTLMVMAWASGKVGLMEMLRAWTIVYAGNFIGAMGVALLVHLSGQPLGGNGAVAAVALKIAVDKVSLPIGQAFFLGILCNVLVCLAVWLTYGARTTSDKVLAILFPVSAFVAAGFEHSVANMYFVPLGLLIKASGIAVGLPGIELGGLTWFAFLASLIPVTAGNIVGGGVLVGGVYWFVYLRPDRH